MKCLTWGCQPSSSAQRNVASFTASLSIANFVAPLFTPRWSWTDNTGLFYISNTSYFYPSIPSVCVWGKENSRRHRMQGRQKQAHNKCMHFVSLTPISYIAYKIDFMKFQSTSFHDFILRQKLKSNAMMQRVSSPAVCILKTWYVPPNFFGFKLAC